MKNGGFKINNWLVRVFSFSDVVEEDSKAASIIPIYKGKSYKRKGTNYRRISILKYTWKYIFEGRVMESLKKNIAKEQGGCIGQISVLNQLIEKYREKRNEPYVAFMNLEKVYDKVCREKFWIVT